MADIFPGLPPLSILTVAGACICIASLTLYLLSKINELLLVSFISLLYAAVPLLAMVKHCW